jgi:WD40 repeat protein
MAAVHIEIYVVVDPAYRSRGFSVNEIIIIIIDCTPKGQSHLVTSIAWSPDGSRLASAAIDETVRVWNLATIQCAAILKGHGRSIETIAWSPDGSRLASTSLDMAIRIWDAFTS